MKNQNLILAAIAFVLILIIGFVFFTNKNFLSNNEPSHIDGTFNINGVIPQGATISLTQKEYNQNTTPAVFAQNLPATDQGTWNFSEAASGTTYVLQALVIVNGQTIARSDTLNVTAPADSEVLTINIEAANDTGETAVISGNIAINGYIPEGATVTVLGKATDETDYTTVASGLPAQRRQFMSYTTAISGTTYLVQGQLIDASGTVIGSSNTIAITAPAHDEELTINSKSAAPTPGPSTPTPAPSLSTLSGSINFNGAAPNNTRIVVFQRVSGQQNYQVAVDNLTPNDGTTWQWNQAKSGTWYDLIAVLKQRQNNGTDKDIATSSTQTVAAPANTIQFSLNSGISLPAPTGSISITCNSLANNTWNATLNFQSVQNAQSYWFQLGSSNGANDRLNQTQGANGSNANQTVTVSNIQNGTTYYARYAYAYVSGVTAGSSDFSSFSTSLPVVCNQ